MSTLIISTCLYYYYYILGSSLYELCNKRLSILLFCRFWQNFHRYKTDKEIKRNFEETMGRGWQEVFLFSEHSSISESTGTRSSLIFRACFTICG